MCLGISIHCIARALHCDNKKKPPEYNTVHCSIFALLFYLAITLMLILCSEDLFQLHLRVEKVWFGMMGGEYSTASPPGRIEQLVLNQCFVTGEHCEDEAKLKMRN